MNRTTAGMIAALGIVAMIAATVGEWRGFAAAGFAAVLLCLAEAADALQKMTKGN